MIEVFKTDIKHRRQSKLLVEKLLEHFPDGDINFDLDDCDRVLRVEHDNVCPKKIMELLAASGHYCEPLP